MALLAPLLVGFALWTPVSGGAPCPPVSDAQQRASEVEPSVAVSSSGVAVAAWQQDRFRDRAAAGIGVGVAAPGGFGFVRVSVPGVSGCSRASDPWVSAGASGVIWLSSLQLESLRRGDFRTRIAVASSSDGGVTWSRPSFLTGGADAFNDKPAVTGDPVRPGVAYVVWTLGSAPWLSSTADGGRTWSPPRRIGGGGTVASVVSVLRDGSLLHTWLAYRDGPPRVMSARSSDRGVSWSSPVRVARLPSPGRSSGPSVRALPFSGTGPAVAPDGSVYEAFSGTKGVSVVVSGDGGRSWSPPRVAVRVPGGAFGPSLAAGPGGLALSYYAHEPGRRASFWIARSLDGRAWRSERIAGPFSLARAPVAGDDVFLGDYSGLAAGPDGRFYAAFSAPPPLAADGRADVLVASRP